MSPSRDRPDRTLVVILGIVGLLVMLAFVAVFTRGEPAEFEADTPEGVVQAYTQAYVSGDYEKARTFVVDAACAGDYYAEPNQDVSVTLVSTDEFPSSAAVRVTITTTYSTNPFGPSSVASDEVFHLTKRGGNWIIDTAPWQFDVCGIQ
ncbi:hypothetical protein [Homoserinimonas hongtaonis]|uniref:DUF4878 domain-containing protein n=1 Tax=Homoserinimonas hongtaonis TaxID=2079791 RepID=A0A2U1SWT5_9MICO|nr:hypothetical protein [Salinibacterium hongtaonis]AWB88678.1 hypothetical protein C2138_03155 [Salinibacterium hongtaonis]PWB96090.1 hypothetical protein DF220_11930 [Salinibacterium hongtaonis]